jgi:hypothetical protein
MQAHARQTTQQQRRSTTAHMSALLSWCVLHELKKTTPSAVVPAHCLHLACTWQTVNGHALLCQLTTLLAA